MTQAFTDETLMAYLHGELNEIESRRIDATVLAEAPLAKRLDALAAQDEDIRRAFSAILSDSVPDHLIATVNETRPEAQLIDLAEARERKSLRKWGWPQAGAIAASLAVGVLVGYQGLGVQQGNDTAIVVASADGPVLAQTVQDFLASAPSGARNKLDSLGTASVAISFKTTDGLLCRQFSVDALTGATDGVACLQGRKWRLQALGLRPSEGGEMRTASGDAAPAVLAAVDALIDGEPLDLADEAAMLKQK